VRPQALAQDLVERVMVGAALLAGPGVTQDVAQELGGGSGFGHLVPDQAPLIGMTT
jgi:hypothetical protein